MMSDPTPIVRVRDVMAAPPVTAAPGEPLRDVLRRMTGNRVGDGEQSVGIVSARQLIARRTAHLDCLVRDRTAGQQRLTGLLWDRERQAKIDLRAAGRLLNRLLRPGPPPDWPELTWAVHFR